MALLAATKKTGELRVVGGKLDGRVHLDAGRVVAADVGRADSFVDAVFELLRLTSGKFSFDADKAPDDAADPVDVEPLLLEAQARLTEWRGIEAVVPSLEHGVLLVKDLTDPHVTLAAEQWRMIVGVAAARCVADVADRLGLGEYGVCKALKELVESGVVDITDPPTPAKAEPKVEVKASEPKVEAKIEKIEPEAAEEAEPEPEPKAVKEDKAASNQAEAKPVIEPELKPRPEPDGTVKVKALTTTDQASPIPPGEEPDAKAKKPEPKAAKPEPKPEPKVDPSQAKALVSQLAAMNSEKVEPKADKAEPKSEKAPAAKADKAEKDAADDAEAAAEATTTAAAAAPEGGEADEPLNRGLLLKFLSSVRQ
jgi:hypothetical protein